MDKKTRSKLRKILKRLKVSVADLRALIGAAPAPDKASRPDDENDEDEDEDEDEDDEGDSL